MATIKCKTSLKTCSRSGILIKCANAADWSGKQTDCVLRAENRIPSHQVSIEWVGGGGGVRCDVQTGLLMRPQWGAAAATSGRRGCGGPFDKWAREREGCLRLGMMCCVLRRTLHCLSVIAVGRSVRRSTTPHSFSFITKFPAAAA
jgi:hypothetical protein